MHNLLAVANRKRKPTTAACMVCDAYCPIICSELISRYLMTVAWPCTTVFLSAVLLEMLFSADSSLINWFYILMVYFRLLMSDVLLLNVWRLEWKPRKLSRLFHSRPFLCSYCSILAFASLCCHCALLHFTLRQVGQNIQRACLERKMLLFSWGLELFF